MVSFTINRVSRSAPTGPQVTEGQDIIRLDGRDNVFGLRSTSSDPFLVDFSIVVAAAGIPAAFGVPSTPENGGLVLDALGLPRQVAAADIVPALLALEAALTGAGVATGLPASETAALALVAQAPAVFGFDIVDGGNDRIFGRGGDDVVFDLTGNNNLSMDDGDDVMYLGAGDDRVFDTGGANLIVDLGGDNSITLLGSSSPFTGGGPQGDIVRTGAGNDRINALAGENVIDAGDGNNSVRGGNSFDEITVGTGNDFVDVRGSEKDEDLNGDGILDLGEDQNFNGVLDSGATDTFAFQQVAGAAFIAGNVVFDAGGDDIVRATSSQSRQGDDLILLDVVVTETLLPDTPLGPVRFLDLAPGVIGTDDVNVSGGDNFIVDAGGDATVLTLDGADVIFTSFFVTGNDEVRSGAGNDQIDVGAGADLVAPGAGTDVIDLGADADADQVVFAGAAEIQQAFTAEGVVVVDLIRNFDFGVDTIDLGPLAENLLEFGIFLTPASLSFSVLNADPATSVFDLGVAADTDADGALDFAIAILEGIDVADVTGIDPTSAFLFDDDIA